MIATIVDGAFGTVAFEALNIYKLAESEETSEACTYLVACSLCGTVLKREFTQFHARNVHKVHV